MSCISESNHTGVYKTHWQTVAWFWWKLISGNIQKWVLPVNTVGYPTWISHNNQHVWTASNRSSHLRCNQWTYGPPVNYKNHQWQQRNEFHVNKWQIFSTYGNSRPIKRRTSMQYIIIWVTNGFPLLENICKYIFFWGSHNCGGKPTTSPLTHGIKKN